MPYLWCSAKLYKITIAATINVHIDKLSHEIQILHPMIDLYRCGCHAGLSTLIAKGRKPG